MAERIGELLRKFAEVDEAALLEFARRVNGAPVAALRDEEKMHEMARALRVDEGTLVRGFVAVVSSAHLARVKFQGDLAKAFAEVAGADAAQSHVSKLVTFATAAGDALSRILSEVDMSAAPTTDLAAYHGMTFRVISITEFHDEFSTTQDVEQYVPRIRREHRRALVSIRTQSGSGAASTASFVASPASLDHMIKFLQLGKRQLLAAIEKDEGGGPGAGD